MREKDVSNTALSIMSAVSKSSVSISINGERQTTEGHHRNDKRKKNIRLSCQPCLLITQNQQHMPPDRSDTRSGVNPSCHPHAAGNHTSDTPHHATPRIIQRRSSQKYPAAAPHGGRRYNHSLAVPPPGGVSEAPPEHPAATTKRSWLNGPSVCHC